MELFVCERFASTVVKHEKAGKYILKINESNTAKAHKGLAMGSQLSQSFENTRVKNKQIPSHVSNRMQ